MKSGAPPDKVGVLYPLLPIEFHVFTSRFNSKGYHTFVPGLISMFYEMVWVSLNVSDKAKFSPSHCKSQQLPRHDSYFEM